jgi:protein-arginine kinase activator protein McsA
MELKSKQATLVLASKCNLCKNTFSPILEGQKFCSATCARAVKDVDELGRIYATFDEMHLKAWLNRKIDG